MNRKFLRFKYAAIRRYGEKHWTAAAEIIEFNPNYTVCISGFEKGDFNTGADYPYIVELSNGTKFLCFMHAYGKVEGEELLSEQGEAANAFVDACCYTKVKNNMNKLNHYQNGKY